MYGSSRNGMEDKAAHLPRQVGPSLRVGAVSKDEQQRGGRGPRLSLPVAERLLRRFTDAVLAGQIALHARRSPLLLGILFEA